MGACHNASCRVVAHSAALKRHNALRRVAVGSCCLNVPGPCWLAVTRVVGEPFQFVEQVAVPVMGAYRGDIHTLFQSSVVSGNNTNSTRRRSDYGCPTTQAHREARCHVHGELAGDGNGVSGQHCTIVQRRVERLHCIRSLNSIRSSGHSRTQPQETSTVQC